MDLSILDRPVFEAGPFDSLYPKESTDVTSSKSKNQQGNLLLPLAPFVNAATYNQPTAAIPVLRSPYDMNPMELYQVSIEDTEMGKSAQQAAEMRARQAHMIMIDNLMKHEGLSDSNVTNLQAQQLLARYQQQMNYMLQHQYPEMRQMKPQNQLQGSSGDGKGASVAGVANFDPTAFFSEGMKKSKSFDINAPPPKPKSHSVNIARHPSSIAPPGIPIYEATYSSSEVYELIVGDIGVMRRKADGWVNGTHILKVAGVDKSKRTKLLDKEVAGEPHERVQGGYGKYQGTWMPCERARKLALDYGVPDQIAPILDLKI